MTQTTHQTLPLSFIQEPRYADYQAKWHDPRSALYHAPQPLMDSLRSGAITEDAMLANTQIVFAVVNRIDAHKIGSGATISHSNGQVKAKANAFLRGKMGLGNSEEGLAFNPNAVGLYMINDPHHSGHHKLNLMDHALERSDLKVLRHLLKRGWEPSGFFGDSGASGLMGMAVKHLRTGEMREIKDWFDQRGWALDLSASSEEYYDAQEDFLNEQDAKAHDPQQDKVVAERGPIAASARQPRVEINSLCDAIDVYDPRKFDLLCEWGVDAYAKDADAQGLGSYLLWKGLSDQSVFKLLLPIIERGAARVEWRQDSTWAGPDAYLIEPSGNCEKITPMLGDTRTALENWRRKVEDQVLVPLNTADHKFKQNETWSETPHAALSAKDMCALYGAGFLGPVAHHAIWHAMPEKLMELCEAAPAHISEALQRANAPLIASYAASPRVHVPAEHVDRTKAAANGKGAG